MDIKFFKFNRNAELPYHGSKDSAGYDLRACLSQDVTIKPGEFKLIETGVGIEIPTGYFGMVCPRSGLAIKHGITVLNSPGIVDSDYRGELKCILINHSKRDFIVEDKMRIVQIIICKYEDINWVETQKIAKSSRGEGGFGSTGIR